MSSSSHPGQSRASDAPPPDESKPPETRPAIAADPVVASVVSTTPPSGGDRDTPGDSIQPLGADEMVMGEVELRDVEVGEDTGAAPPPADAAGPELEAEIIGQSPLPPAGLARQAPHPGLARPRPLWRQLIDTIASLIDWMLGVVTLIFGLALLATIPVFQMLSLGYLMEVSGRVARTGRLRDGWIGVRKASRVGSIVLGTWIFLLPVRFVGRIWYAAHLVDPGGPRDTGWRIGLLVTLAICGAHILWAWYRGGRWRHFLWPAPWQFLRFLAGRGTASEPLGRRMIGFVRSLHLPAYFWLGLQGFAAAMMWLFIPVVLLIGATALPAGPAVVCGMAGSLLLAGVVIHLPLLQAQLAAERRWSAGFNLIGVYVKFARAPFSCWLSLALTLSLALPLYLLKIELTPREVLLLPSLFFVVFMLPARWFTGWAAARGSRTDSPKYLWFHLPLCLVSLIAIIPTAGFYVFAVFFTRYTSWHGVWSLFEQHAFLVPVPFLGL